MRDYWDIRKRGTAFNDDKVFGAGFHPAGRKPRLRIDCLPNQRS
jgi:hypothetical protein